MVSIINTTETYFTEEDVGPDSNYILNESELLLEYTPDTRLAAFCSGFDLNRHFTQYDAFYSREGASPAILNLITLMDEWTENSDNDTQSLIYNSVIFDSHDQLKDLIESITSFLVDSYLKTNNIEEPEHLHVVPFFTNNNSTNRITISNQTVVLDNNIHNYFDTNINFVNDVWFSQYQETPLLNIYEEEDIAFPANIASVILQNNRYHHYTLRLKKIIKKALETNTPLYKTLACYKKYQNKSNVHKNLETSNINLKNNHKSIDFVKKENNAKKVLKKGIKKFSNLFGSTKINNFISGDGFMVEGAKFNWFFKQKNNCSIINLTHSPMAYHIPYSLSVLSKDNVMLADCCVYVINDTPIIDQLITISLYIQHDEESLLNKTNFFNKRPEFAENNELFPESKRMKNTQINTFNEEQMAMSQELIKKRDEYYKYKNDLNAKYSLEVKKILSSILGINIELLNFMLLKNTFDLIPKNCQNTLSEIYNENIFSTLRISNEVIDG